uniref:Uncharacterized protein n=1 Tax=Lotus japonicus TaxID=34305 RepID=I3S3K9_LOTJA|nr:unknown [Lotus japonicus]
MSKAAAKITIAADPETATLFKTAPLAAGPGASDGGPEMEEGVMAAGTAAGDSSVEEGETAGETGVAVGDNAFLGGAADSDLVGDEAGDWAIVELKNKAATSIKGKKKRAIERK